MSKCALQEAFHDLSMEIRFCAGMLPTWLRREKCEGDVDSSLLRKYLGITDELRISKSRLRWHEQESWEGWERWPETIITEEEARIAEKIRRCCNEFGEEREEKLNESAACFLELGLLYQTFAINGEGTKQKLNFIKSAALITGAIVRYTKIEKSEGLELAKKELRALHQKLLMLDCVKGDKSKNILALTEEIKGMLEQYRKKIEEKLEKIVQIRDGEGEEDTIDDEQTKVVEIKKICEQVTEHYIDIMKKIADYCELIMGRAPCQFVIVGLGSLARKEVTLYSDFEHAIVLEDGLDEDSPMREYFRWFTTIFQIFVIGLGETVIPSVDIRSLCNLYSDEKNKKWFSDRVTPCGISFDGTMAHACKFPHGRQNEAKYRKDIVELIQPVKTMANYLTQEEDLKNGYFLSDVLSRHCFVFGSQTVYDAFCQESKRILEQITLEDIANKIQKNIQLNPNEPIRNFNELQSMKSGSIKASTYRPMTAFLSYASSLCRLEAQSSFEIIDEMKNAGSIDDECHHTLMYAVAVTMEVRMKTYLMTGHQRQVSTYQDFAKMVGLRSMTDCFVTLEFLKFQVLSIVYSAQSRHRDRLWIKLPLRNRPYWKLQKLLFLCFALEFTEFAKLGLKLLREFRKKIEMGELGAIGTEELLRFILTQLVQGFDDYVRAVGYSPVNCQILEDMCKFLSLVTNDIDYENREIINRYLCTVYMEQNRVQLALETFDKWSYLCFKHGLTGGQDASVIFSMWHVEISCMIQSMDADDIKKRISIIQMGQTDNVRQHLMAICACVVMLKRGLLKRGRSALKNLVVEIKKNASSLGQFYYYILLLRIKYTQGIYGFVTDSLITEEIVQSFLKDQNLKGRSSDFLCASLTTRSGISKHIEWREVPPYSILKSITLFTVCNALSYREMASAIDLTLKSQRMFSYNADIRKMSLEPAVGCFMILLEKVRRKDVALLVNQLQSVAVKVRHCCVLQPFVYSGFKDLISFRRRANAALKKFMRKQNSIFKGLFGFSVNRSWLYDKAVRYFISLQFKECAELLWKLLHCSKNETSTQQKCFKLFTTTLLTFLILQKRRNPPEYFKRTREISLAQHNQFKMIMLGDLKTEGRSPIEWYQHYRYYSDPLVPIYNLAIEGLNYDGDRKFVDLLWAIINAPHASDRIKGDSTERFFLRLSVLLHPPKKFKFQFAGKLHSIIGC